MSRERPQKKLSAFPGDRRPRSRLTGPIMRGGGPALPVLALILFTLVPAGMYPFDFQPIVMDFSTRGNGTVKTFTVRNTTTAPVAVQVSIVKRDMLPDGTEVTEPSSADFIIYPSQVLLRPGATQLVRVRWSRGGTIVEELPYRIIAEQLPVDLEPGNTEGGSLQFMFRYVGSLYVVPDRPAPSVTVESAEVVRAQKGPPLLRLNIRNGGNAHTIIGEPELTILSHERSTSGGSAPGAHVLKGEALSVLAGENILAGRSRHFLIPVPESLPEGRIDARLSFESIR